MTSLVRRCVCFDRVLEQYIPHAVVKRILLPYATWDICTACDLRHLSLPLRAVAARIAGNYRPDFLPGDDCAVAFERSDDALLPLDKELMRASSRNRRRTLFLRHRHTQRAKLVLIFRGLGYTVDCSQGTCPFEKPAFAVLCAQPSKEALVGRHFVSRNVASICEGAP